MNYKSNIQPKPWCELCDSVWIPAKLNFEPCLGDDLTRWQVNEEVYRSCDLQGHFHVEFQELTDW